jgi:hypothetical protein
MSKGFMAAFLETDLDVALAERHVRDRVDEVAEDVLGLGGRLTVAEPLAEQSIQTAGHQRELQASWQRAAAV